LDLSRHSSARNENPIAHDRSPLRSHPSWDPSRLVGQPIKMSKNPAPVAPPSVRNTRPFQLLQLCTTAGFRPGHNDRPFFWFWPSTINHQPRTIHQLLLSMAETLSHPHVRVAVTLHGLHDLQGNGGASRHHPPNNPNRSSPASKPADPRLRFGRWKFIGHWSLVIGHWSLVIGHWSFTKPVTFQITTRPPQAGAVSGCPHRPLRAKFLLATKSQLAYGEIQ
jgi:hypothetical protein